MKSAGRDHCDLTMPRILIVAYGNPLRCDDGIGWHAAELLRRELTPSLARIICTHQLAPELAEAACHADIVIFVDAACDQEPGRIACSKIRPDPEAASFSHQLSPEQVIALCQQLYAHCPRCYTVSVVGEFFDHGDTLSATLANSLPRLVETVKELIRR